MSEYLVALLPPATMHLIVAAHGLSDVYGFDESENRKSIGHA